MRKLILCCLAVFLTGCSDPADLIKLKREFLANRPVYEQLHEMISADSSKQPFCIVVSNRWADWLDQRNHPASLGLSKARYDTYLSLLARTGALIVGYCHGRKKGWTQITLFYTADDAPGCYTSYQLNGDKSVPKTGMTANFMRVIIPLQDGWFISHNCS